MEVGTSNLDVDEKSAQRPLGVTLIACLLACYAVLTLFAVLTALKRPELFRSPQDDDLRMALHIVVLAPLRAVLAGALASGLWSLKDWARRGFLFFAVWAAFSKTLGLLMLRWLALGLSSEQLQYVGYVQVLVAVALAGYLSLPSVAQAFRLEDNDVQQ